MLETDASKLPERIASFLLGLFAIANEAQTGSNGALASAMENTLRAVFTPGALGTGLAVPILLLRRPTLRRDERRTGT